METERLTISQDLREEADGYKYTDIAINPDTAIRAAATIDALVAALEFYAKPENWHTDWDERNECCDDRGSVARAALALARKGG